MLSKLTYTRFYQNYPVLPKSSASQELLVFSNKILSAALEDSWRYPAEMWMDWDKREARR